MDLAQHLFDVQMGESNVFASPSCVRTQIFKFQLDTGIDSHLTCSPLSGPDLHVWYFIKLITLGQNNMYTPPTLPSHINFPLQPVTGAPSDAEVKLVHQALRASENLANGMRYLYELKLEIANASKQLLPFSIRI